MELEGGRHPPLPSFFIEISVSDGGFLFISAIPPPSAMKLSPSPSLPVLLQSGVPMTSFATNSWDGN